MELKWEISKVLSDKNTGLILEVTYTLIASKDKNRIIKTGKVSFSGDPSSESFIPFEELNESQVLDWVKSSLGDKVSSIEQLASDELNALLLKQQSIATTNKPLLKSEEEILAEEAKKEALMAERLALLKKSMES